MLAVEEPKQPYQGKPQTDKEKVLHRMQRGFSITQLEALKMFGCMRLASIINRLRNDGHDIKTIMVEDKGKTYALYYMPLTFIHTVHGKR